MLKIMFMIGIAALFGILLLIAINGDDLKSLVCMDFKSSGNNVNHCEKMIAIFVPVLFLMPLSIFFHLLRFEVASLKKKILIASLVYPLFIGTVMLLDKTCNSSWCDIGADSPLGFLLIIFFPLFPTLLFSLITYKMREEVFLAWCNFSYWWIPLSVLLVLITPESNSVIMSWGKEIPAIGMTILYVAISTGIILGKSFKLRFLSTSAIIFCLIILVLVATYAYRMLT